MGEWRRWPRHDLVRRVRAELPRGLADHHRRKKMVPEEGVWAFDLLQTLELSCGAAGFVWEVARSAKSTPPDSTRNLEAGYQVGSWVQLVGLKKVDILKVSI